MPYAFEDIRDSVVVTGSSLFFENQLHHIIVEQPGQDSYEEHGQCRVSARNSSFPEAVACRPGKADQEQNQRHHQEFEIRCGLAGNSSPHFGSVANFVASRIPGRLLQVDAAGSPQEKTADSLKMGASKNEDRPTRQPLTNTPHTFVDPGQQKSKIARGRLALLPGFPKYGARSGQRPIWKSS
jgi:hypothetical protein